MSPHALLEPAEYVWLPDRDAGRPEPAPAGAGKIRAVHLSRRIGRDEAARTVLLETAAGLVPLPRRIRLHGDADEGWDWGWRGSALLETSLNLLAAFVHPRAAWRLQWAFCEAFLHPLPPAGGVLGAKRILAWLQEHRWIGYQGRWEALAEGERAGVLAREAGESRRLAPDTRARRVQRLMVSVVGSEAADRRESDVRVYGDAHGFWGAATLAGGAAAPGTPGFQLLRAAAILSAAPARERWATVAALARMIPHGEGRWRREWHEVASPVTPGLPDPETIATIQELHLRLGGRPAAERAELVAASIRARAGSAGARWQDVPSIALPLGAGFPDAFRGDPHLAGDPVAAAATLHALRSLIARDPSLAAAAEGLGLTPPVIAGQIRAAHQLHVCTLRDERRSADAAASAEGEYVRAAEAARLPRTRSRRPPHASSALVRWALAAPEATLEELAWLAAGPGGPVYVGHVLEQCGIRLPDPPGTVAQALRWYLEERVPRLLDLPSFLGRGDGLFQTPAAPRPPGGA
jgi:hypothetical protein